uniref:Venom toxin n=1 Tax=Hemiscorpius lepturus TaxID=520031 RepID=A0A1L4BJ92_HEMLE|nr:venom toxin [Hemiscorpius lepturus]
MHATFLVIFLCLAFALSVLGTPYYGSLDDSRDGYNDGLARYILYTRKRSCIRRGGSCDYRPNGCCYRSSCRCNLWGTNCRCQRQGLFQKLGK